MKISECMTTDVCVIAPDRTMQSAARTMADIDAGFLPVAEHDQLIGIITDRDIAIRGVAAGQAPDVAIRDIISSDIEYCYVDDDVQAVLDHMADLQLRRLPVIDEDKHLVGIVSIGDLAVNGDSARAGEALSDITRPSALHSQTVRG